jgi:uncharacterized protein
MTFVSPETPMKTTFSFLVAVLLLAVGWRSAAAADTEPTASAKVTFLLIYRPGPAWPQGKKVSELPLKEHGNYMLSLYKKGAMKLAGPLTDNAGGAVVLEVSGESEAQAIVADDPAVRAGLFVSELHPWAPVSWEKFLEK